MISHNLVASPQIFGVPGGVYSAVIVVDPKLMEVARPAASIFATKTSLEPHVTKFVRSWVAGLPL